MSLFSRFLTNVSYVLLICAVLAFLGGPAQLAYAFALGSVVAMMGSSILNFAKKLFSLSKEIANPQTEAPLEAAEAKGQGSEGTEEKEASEVAASAVR